MGKPTVAHLYNGILLSKEKEGTTDTCKNMDESQMYYAKWKKQDLNGYMLHDSIYIKFWKRQNSRTYQWLPEAGGKERVLPQGGVFRVMEWFSILSMVVIHMTCFC